MSVDTSHFNVLFLCTGNSARSIIAESILNRIGRGRFTAYSAGSHPKGEVHPQALALLERLGHPVDRLRSKPWDEFAAPGAPYLNFVITVCNNAACEVCPVWPGQPVTSHWGMPDPAAAAGSEAQIALAFADVYRMLNNRIGIFTSLPMEELHGLALKEKVDEISRVGEVTQAASDAQVQAISPDDPRMEPLFDTLIAWLGAAKLPVDDLADDQPRYFVLRGEGDRPLAFGGLAGGAPDLLLRSFVVDPAARDQGVGARMLAALATVARDSGAERLWLLTSDAAPWFETAGWRRVDRAEAPAAIAKTGQFSRVCPTTAALLVRDLAA